MHTKELVGGHNLPQMLHGKLTIKETTTTADIRPGNLEIVQRTVLVELCFSGSSQRSHPVHSVQEKLPSLSLRAGREPGRSPWAHPTSHKLEA